MASSAPGARKTRDEVKKAKELDEARKAGTAPAELDEEGNEINPHIPQYILQAPWYLSSDKPTLKHQRVQSDKVAPANTQWYARGQKAGPAATKFRKGACANCGAKTHNAKTCVERPRKVGAKYTQSDIQADEVVQSVSLDYDGKRDRWNGYDPDHWDQVMQTHERTEQERRKKKAEMMVQKALESAEKGGTAADTPAAEKSVFDSDSDEGASDDEDLKEQVGFNNAPVQKMDPKTHTTVRNLRMREDVAKYLRNLDVNSAHYDPKTRSMRENPNPMINPAEAEFSGDNFTRASGQASSLRDMQAFAWEAYEKGQDVHLLSMPSQAELLYKEYKQKKEALNKKAREAIVGKYGGTEHLEAPPRELLLAQTESFVQYSADGRVLKGDGLGLGEKAVVVRSRYEEDVYLSNHTSVWGSWCEGPGVWGFACCHETLKSAYCTGAAGIAAKEKLMREMAAVPETPVEEEEEAPLSLMEQNKLDRKKHDKAKKKKEKKEKKEKEERFKKALKREEDRAKGKDVDEDDERKRKYNSLGQKEDFDVTEEDVEAYNLKRVRADDPMAQFLGKDRDE
eukprot:TRINITY_DN4027_c0_g1_i2.p1 TRINITY_DN4027_c0_g1~~TRINITY_DN4027_c0_g1_i2.p1  ORF type:complete len:580 (+),score=206.34 TRINITY_DN4027_c0_g1_i2:38-1741(+)